MAVSRGEYNFAYLLAGLLLLMLVGPISRELFPDVADLIIGLLISATLLLGTRTLRAVPRWHRISVGLAVIGIILTLLDLIFSYRELVLGVMAVLFLFTIVMTGAIGRRVLFGGVVDVNKILGAICIYLLLGLAWGLVYLFLHITIPGAFNGVAVGDRGAQLSQFIYYSFVTLTTLGYGDVAPVNAVPRALAYLEAVFGQMYIAVLVASLVGILISERTAAKDERVKTPAERPDD